MISAIRGTLEAVTTDSAIVDVGGVSFRVYAPTSTLNRLPPIGETVRLVTHLYLREDALALYGFLSPEELALFEQLLGVSGVGPRLALAILSAASPESLRQAIATERVEALMAIPGIGRKLAGRLILELRGKLVAPADATTSITRSPDAEVVEALLNLGYSPADAQAAVKSLPPDGELDLEERIRRALQYFARR